MNSRSFSLPPETHDSTVVLQFRPFLRTGEKVLKIVGVGGIAILLVMWVLFGKASQWPTWASAASLPIILWLEGHFLYRPLASRKVYILDSGLRMETLGKGVDIPFGEIAKVKIFCVSNLGGLLKLETIGGTKFNLPVSLLRSDLLIEALVAARSDLFPDSEKVLRYRRTAILGDHSFQRWGALRAGWKGELTRVVLVALPIAALKLESLGLATGALLISAGVWLIAHSLADIPIVLRGRKFLIESPAYGPRNLAFEARMFGIAKWAHLGLMLGAGSLLWVAYFLLK